jgi:hypothetical protein
MRPAYLSPRAPICVSQKYSSSSPAGIAILTASGEQDQAGDIPHHTHENAS